MKDKCEVCKKELDYKPIRIVVQTYRTYPYKQYSQVSRKDFCKDCFKKVKEVLNENNLWWIQYESRE